jgi:hemerythrin
MVYRLRITVIGAGVAGLLQGGYLERQGMEHIVWSPLMSVGIPALDSAHKEVLEEMTRLSSTTDADFRPGLFALIARLERDFRAEEELMEAIDFPALLSHREQHAGVLSGLHHVVPRVMNGDIASGRKAVDLLPQWFLFHLPTMDAALAVAVDEAGLRATRSVVPARAG